MVLIDTSVWIDFLRRGEPLLARWIEEGVVRAHPSVIEELACGTLDRREEILEMLESLPMAPAASHREFLEFVRLERLGGSGLSSVDVHLLASARLGGDRLWTHDKTLRAVAKRLGLEAAVDAE